MDGHGLEKFRDADLLATSANRPWSLLAAEIRRHGPGEISAFTPHNAEITQIIRGAPEAMSTRSSGGVRQEVAARPGTIWLCPAGIREEATRLSADMPEVLHVYIAPHSFLEGELASLDFRAQDLRYQAQVQNPRVGELLERMKHELREETSAAGLKMDLLAVDLIATLAADHAETPREDVGAGAPGLLDRRRLDRVLSFINDNLDRDISVLDLAEVACVSLFHFSRAFSLTIGLSPHAYLSRRRLDLSRRMLAWDGSSLAQVALACGFSNQANFTRAFTRATGVSPGRYRQVFAAR
ncbi:helix-turn-helix domain-containing protein [Brevundimonas sp.]|uniref:helix-turn-helix domain-containing protein n=1 Tax=Brevundimonas sp. TaxID=1871086 RepID=UPI0037BF4D55